jgi:hypothetical protein
VAGDESSGVRFDRAARDGRMTSDRSRVERGQGTLWSGTLPMVGGSVRRSSASPGLLHQSSETLVGRIAFHTLNGFHLDEMGPDKLDGLWP